VTTPAILFLGQVLAQCPLTNPLHPVAGLFVAQLVLHVRSRKEKRKEKRKTKKC
jgi:hypothetical protein